MKNIKNKMALVALAVGVMSISTAASAFSHHPYNFNYGGVKAGVLMLDDVEANIDNEDVKVDTDELGGGAITFGLGRDYGSNSLAFELDIYATEKSNGEVAYVLDESDDIKDKASVKAKGAAASVAYRHRLQQKRLFDSTGMYLKAKAGLAYNKLDVEFGFGNDSERYSDSDTNFLIGAGVGYYLNDRTSLELSYDYQDSGVGLASLAINRRF